MTNLLEELAEMSRSELEDNLRKSMLVFNGMGDHYIWETILFCRRLTFTAFAVAAFILRGEDQIGGELHWPIPDQDCC